MSESLVVVTGANGLVGARVCRPWSSGARPCVPSYGVPAPRPSSTASRSGSATSPTRPSRRPWSRGASAVVTTVHPMGSDRETQHRIGVEGTAIVAGAAADAGVDRLVHVSTAAVYDRSPGVGDVDEAPRWWPTTPTTTPSPSATPTSPWPTSTASPGSCCARPRSSAPARPRSGTRSAPPHIRDDERARRAIPDADLRLGPRRRPGRPRRRPRLRPGPDLRRPRDRPGRGGCTPVNVAAGPATHARLLRDRHRSARRRPGLGRRARRGPGGSSPTGPAAGAGRRRSTSPGAGRDRARACGAERGRGAGSIDRAA